MPYSDFSDRCFERAILIDNTDCIDTADFDLVFHHQERAKLIAMLRSDRVATETTGKIALDQTDNNFGMRKISTAQKCQSADTLLYCTCDGVVDKQDRKLRFTLINLRPHLVLRNEQDREKALRVLEKSESGCLVSASLSTPVRTEPTVTVVEWFGADIRARPLMQLSAFLSSLQTSHKEPLCLAE